MDPDFFTELQSRRRKICELLGKAAKGSKSDALLLFSAEVALRNGDVEHTYRQDSDFYYLTGFHEPESAVLLFNDEPHFVLFVRERDKEREIWDGRRAGTEGAISEFGADEAHPISAFSERLTDYLEDRTRLHFLFGQEERWDKLVLSTVGQVRRRRRKRVEAPSELVDARMILHEARLIKTAFEQQKMAEVGELSARGHRLAMEGCQPGLSEWDLQTIVETSFRRSGARRLAYDSIVGSGANGTILHYRENDRRMEAGDLVLIDAGAELEFLAADITRTFPVSGRFSPVQRRLYEIVLGAQLAAIQKVRIGATLDEIHEAACGVLLQGLKAEGLMRAEDLKDEPASRERLKRFYMHQTSHYLGMDVHDVGAYHLGGELRKLEAGMVLTVEPGLYFAEDDDTIPQEYRGIGIRIEDDILVTTGGGQNLTSSAPKTVEEIEQACSTAAP
jgi:Xaa-Pro aminopeptidase